MSAVKSPLKYHGGKSYLAKKIIELLPPRDTWHLWREPYFGGGSVTLALDPEGISEAVNDVDEFLTDFWKVLCDKTMFPEFLRAVEAIPFGEVEFNLSSAVAEEKGRAAWTGFSMVDLAVFFFIACRQSRQGLMRDFATPTRRLRRGMNENVSAWLSAIDGLPEVHARLKRIEIRNMDAIEFIKKYDDPRAVFYCDPPYLHSTRSTGGGEYRHEMSERGHVILLALLSPSASIDPPFGVERWSGLTGNEPFSDLLESIAYQPQGRFLVSGYPSKLYDELLNYWPAWRRVDIKIDNKASGKKSKSKVIECVWMNY